MFFTLRIEWDSNLRPSGRKAPTPTTEPPGPTNTISVFREDYGFSPNQTRALLLQEPKTLRKYILIQNLPRYLKPRNFILATSESHGDIAWTPHCRLTRDRREERKKKRVAPCWPVNYLQELSTWEMRIIIIFRTCSNIKRIEKERSFRKEGPVIGIHSVGFSCMWGSGRCILYNFYFGRSQAWRKVSQICTK